MMIELYELHPGFGEFAGAEEIYRGKVDLPFVVEGQHIYAAGNDYLIRRVTHVTFTVGVDSPPTPLDYRTTVHVEYNGKAVSR